VVLIMSLKFSWALVRPSCNPRQHFLDSDLPFLRGDREFLNRIIGIDKYLSIK